MELFEVLASTSDSVPSLFSKIILVITASLAYCASIAFYRLYLHPLAKFPGPPLAVISFWYEFYYDVVLSGRYTWKVEELHEQYGRLSFILAGELFNNEHCLGPIIRINPYELHVRDPNAYDKIYPGASAGKRDKWHWSAKMFAVPNSMVATLPHDHHRLRRGQLSSYFSRRSVMVLEPMIRSLVDQLCENIHKYKNSGRPVNLTNAVASLTMDVITEYSFSTSQHCVDSDNFEGGRRMLESLKGPTEMCHVVKQFGWLLPVLKSMPVWLAKKLNPQMAGILDFEHVRPYSVTSSDLTYETRT